MSTSGIPPSGVRAPLDVDPSTALLQVLLAVAIGIFQWLSNQRNTFSPKSSFIKIHKSLIVYAAINLFIMLVEIGMLCFAVLSRHHVTKRGWKGLIANMPLFNPLPIGLATAPALSLCLVTLFKKFGLCKCNQASRGGMSSMRDLDIGEMAVPNLRWSYRLGPTLLGISIALLETFVSFAASAALLQLLGCASVLVYGIAWLADLGYKQRAHYMHPLSSKNSMIVTKHLQGGDGPLAAFLLNARGSNLPAELLPIGKLDWTLWWPIAGSTTGVGNGEGEGYLEAGKSRGVNSSLAMLASYLLKAKAFEEKTITQAIQQLKGDLGIWSFSQSFYKRGQDIRAIANGFYCAFPPGLAASEASSVFHSVKSNTSEASSTLQVIGQPDDGHGLNVKLRSELIVANLLIAEAARRLNNRETQAESGEWARSAILNLLSVCQWDQAPNINDRLVRLRAMIGSQLGEQIIGLIIAHQALLEHAEDDAEWNGDDEMKEFLLAETTRHGVLSALMYLAGLWSLVVAKSLATSAR